MNWEVVLNILAIAGLLLLSGFFSGSETALTATSRARIHQLAKGGNKRAEHTDKLIDDRERLIGAILLGNNLVNILASALATSLFLSLFGDAGVAYATLVMTALVVVFAEVLPKTYAISDPESRALSVTPIISVLVKVFAPVVSFVQILVRFTLKMVGINVDDTEVLSAMDEIRGAIDLHHHEGRVKKRYRDMLGSILDLRDVDVEEVMVHRRNIMMIDANSAPDSIVRQVMDSSFTRLPLYQDDTENIIGVLHAKDVLRVLVGDPDGLKDDASVHERLLGIASEPWFVPENTNLLEQLEAFRRRQAHFALVVDEYGALMGLITLEDILEEIVGEITDEHDVPVEGVRPEAGGRYVVDGWVTIRDLNRELEWTLPDDEATTIAGLVIHEARSIPTPGQTFSFHGFTFEVMRRQRNQVTTLRVTPPAKKEAIV